MRDDVGGKSQRAACGYGGQQVVQVRHGARREVIAVDLAVALLLDGEGLGPVVDRDGLERRRLVGETAGVAPQAADVTQVAGVVGEVAAADGAGVEVVDDALGSRRVAGQVAHGVIRPVGVAQRQAGADEVVAVEDKAALVGNGLGKDVKDVAHVGVPGEGVPVQVGHDDELGLDVGEGELGAPLVQLEHGVLALGLARDG